MVYVAFSVQHNTSIVLPLLLNELRVAEVGCSHGLSFVEADGTRLALPLPHKCQFECHCLSE